MSKSSITHHVLHVELGDAFVSAPTALPNHHHLRRARHPRSVVLGKDVLLVRHDLVAARVDVPGRGVKQMGEPGHDGRVKALLIANHHHAVVEQAIPECLLVLAGETIGVDVPHAMWECDLGAHQ